MAKSKEKRYQSWLKLKGFSTIAKELKLNYETVRRWGNKGDRVPDPMKLKLIKMSKGELEIKDFF